MQPNNQYLPCCEDGRRLPRDATPEQSVRMWIDLMRTADQIQLARFAAEVGLEKAEDAYREWLRGEVHKPRPHKDELARKVNSIGARNVD